MNIALLTNGIWPLQIGGMQKHSYFLAQNLAEKGHQVEVYFPATEEFDLSTFPISKSVFSNLHFIEIDRPPTFQFPGHYILDEYLYSREVLKIYLQQEQKRDLIYIQGFSGWALLRYLHQKKLNIPTIANFHGLEMFQKSASLKSWLINAYFQPFVKQNLRLATAVQSLGGKLSGILEKAGIKTEKIFELGIGLDENWLESRPSFLKDSQPIRFVFLGRYERRKGIEELTAVLKNIGNEYAYQFDFIGPIPESKQLKGIQVKYHGLIKSKDSIQQILQLSDVLVCPSYSEGMPTVILEAMASGCAIIATDVGAVSEQVSIENGWLVSAGNKDQLQAALLAVIIANEEDLLAKKQASLKRIKEKFLWSKLIEEHISQFQRIIRESQQVV